MECDLLKLNRHSEFLPKIEAKLLNMDFAEILEA